MHDVAMIAIENQPAPPPKLPPRRGLGRFTLDIRQTISPWKQAGILGGSLAIGLAISVVILDLAGIQPALDDVERSGDAGQQIVVIMRDAAGQLPDRLHLL